jgi:hypothetical protein
LGVPHIFQTKFVGGTVSPPPVHRKAVYQTIYRAFRRGDEAAQDLLAWQRLFCIDIPAFKP